MPVFIWRQHTASETETRLVEVKCEKCDCTYFYHLTREGSGTEHSAYLLFENWARETAVAKAREEAKRRLSLEAELVPCPRCYWINDELIEGFRRTCFRGWIEQSVWAAVIGIGVCALVVSLSVGIPGHSNDALFFGIFAPLLLISAVLGVVLFVRTMRQRINPNSRYPERPRLRGRILPSYVLDAESGQLISSSQDMLGEQGF